MKHISIDKAQLHDAFVLWEEKARTYENIGMPVRTREDQIALPAEVVAAENTKTLWDLLCSLK